jgi:hypothetical protein
MTGTSLPIVDVDEFGLDADGDSYDAFAAPEMVEAGLLLNRPVLIRLPDGRLLEANQVRITPAGFEHLQRMMAGRQN